MKATREPKSYRVWLQRKGRRLASIDDLNVQQFEEGLAVLRDSSMSSTSPSTDLMLKLFHVTGLFHIFRDMLWSATCAYVRRLPAGLDRVRVLKQAKAYPKSSFMFSRMVYAVGGVIPRTQADEFMADVLDKMFSTRIYWPEDDLWWMYTNRRGMDCEDVIDVVKPRRSKAS